MDTTETLALLNSVLDVEEHPLTLPTGPRMVVSTCCLSGDEPSTVESGKRAGLPPRSPAIRKRQRGQEACLGCSLSTAGPEPLTCLGRLSEAAASPLAGYGSASPAHSVGGSASDASDKKSRPRTTGKGLCERFEDTPDTVVSVAASSMYVVAGDIKSQVLRIMYTKWDVMGHHKLRMPGDPKTVAFTVLVFSSDSGRDHWLSNYGVGQGNKKYNFALQPWVDFVAANRDFAAPGSDGNVQWRSCRVHRLRTGPGKYIGKMCMLQRFPGGLLRPMHDKCLDCYPHRIKNARVSPSVTPTASGSTEVTKDLIVDGLAKASPTDRGNSDAGDTSAALEASRTCLGCVLKLGPEAASAADPCDVADGKFVCGAALSSKLPVTCTLFVMATKAVFFGDDADVNAKLDARDIALTLRHNLPGAVAVHVLPARASGAAALVQFGNERDAEDAVQDAQAVPGMMALAVEVRGASEATDAHPAVPGAGSEIPNGSLMWTPCAAASLAAGGDPTTCATFGLGMCPILLSSKHSLVATDGANISVLVPMAVNRRDKATKTMSCSHCVERVGDLAAGFAALSIGKK